MSDKQRFRDDTNYTVLEAAVGVLIRAGEGGIHMVLKAAGHPQLAEAFVSVEVAYFQLLKDRRRSLAEVVAESSERALEADPELREELRIEGLEPSDVVTKIRLGVCEEIERRQKGLT